MVWVSPNVGSLVVLALFAAAVVWQIVKIVRDVRRGEEGDVVLDPFCGSDTTGVVALEHNRSFVGVELNAEYIELAMERLRLTPLLMEARV